MGWHAFERGEQGRTRVDLSALRSLAVLAWPWRNTRSFVVAPDNKSQPRFSMKFGLQLSEPAVTCFPLLQFLILHVLSRFRMVSTMWLPGPPQI
jgi:hypothetical protein